MTMSIYLGLPIYYLNPEKQTAMAEWFNQTNWQKARGNTLEDRITNIFIKWLSGLKKYV